MRHLSIHSILKSFSLLPLIYFYPVEFLFTINFIIITYHYNFPIKDKTKRKKNCSSADVLLCRSDGDVADNNNYQV